MSGYYPNGSGAVGYVSGRKEIGPDRLTWSQHFAKHGYHTARVGKIFHMGVPGDIESGSDGADDPDSWHERFNSKGPEWKAKGDGELLENNRDGTKPVKGGNTLELVKADEIRLLAGEVEITATDAAPVELHGPDKQKLSVKGMSWKGTETTDNYSLNGFSAAMDKIDVSCK